MSLLLNVLSVWDFFSAGSQVNGCHVPPCHQAHLVRPHPTHGFCFTSPFVWLTPILSLCDTLDLLILGLLKPATAEETYLCVKTPGSHRRRLTENGSAEVGIFHILAEEVCGKDLSLEEFLELGGLDQLESTLGCLMMSGKPSFLTNGPWGDLCRSEMPPCQARLGDVANCWQNRGKAIGKKRG